MFHEILLALAGHPGDLILEHEDSFRIDEDIPFLHDSEKELINRLALIGYQYRTLERFCMEYRSSAVCMGIPSASVLVEHSGQSDVSSIHRPRGVCSVYPEALCCGLTEILDAYRERLLRLEEEYGEEERRYATRNGAMVAAPDRSLVLSSEKKTDGADNVRILPIISLSYVRESLSEFESLFPHVISVSRTVRMGGRASEILDAIFLHTHSGFPLVRECFHRLMFHCLRVFFAQVRSWMLYGTLWDDFDEFFVGLKEKSVPNEDSTSRGEIEDNEDAPDISVEAEFVVRRNKVPTFLPNRVAEKILFTGSAVRVLRRLGRHGDVGNTGPLFSVHSSMSGASSRKNRATQSRADFSGTTSASLLDSSVLPASEITRFSRLLSLVESADMFSISAFERVVECIRDGIGHSLWQYVVGDPRSREPSALKTPSLRRYLVAIKNFFLMGAGEFFQTFFTEADHLLSMTGTALAALEKRRSMSSLHQELRAHFSVSLTKSPPSFEFVEELSSVGDGIRSPSKNRSLSVAFSSDDDDSIMNRFSLGFLPPRESSSQNASSSESDANPNPSSLNAGATEREWWRRTILKFSPPAPLHLLIDEDAIRALNAVFSLFLCLRRSQILLEKCWLVQKEHKSSNSSNPLAFSSINEDPALAWRLWILRAAMAFFINNLGFYFQVDVVEVQFRELFRLIDQSEDFEQVQRAHRVFLENLTNQSFISSIHIKNSVLSLCDCATRLDVLVTRLSSSSEILLLSDIEKLQQEFHRKSQLLVTLLSGRKVATPAHLTQLLLRLEYNVNFDKALLR